MDNVEKEFYKKILHLSLQRLFDELWKIIAVGGLLAVGGYLAFRAVEKHQMDLERICEEEKQSDE